MRKSLLIALAMLASVASSAQEKFPVKGVLKQMSIEANGDRMTKMPEILYKNHRDDKALMIWIYPDNGMTSYRTLSWRVETAPKADDPFAHKIKTLSNDAYILSWYNNYRNFYSYPSGIWIDETWERPKGDADLARLSEVLSHVNDTKKLFGSWARVAVQIPEHTGDTLHIARGLYKVYGEKDCLQTSGSFYDIENAHQAWLRPFAWDSSNEFTEAGVKHKITFVSPTKILLEYETPGDGRVIETWIRHKVPEPVAALMEDFR